MRFPRGLDPAVCLGAVALLSACATAPYTQRRQFILFSAQQEAALGVQAFDQVKSQSKLSRDEELTEMVLRVGRRIAEVAERPDFQWEFVVIEEDVVNAFCLPGGKVAFYTGIIPVCRDEAGVAVVMGHEVAHALARHGAERMSQGQVAAVGGALLEKAVADKTPEARQGIMAAYGLGASVGVLLPFGRGQESEADRIGLILMAKAGYDPRAAPDFWRRMSEKSGGKKPPEFLSTHPGDETRIRRIEEWMPEALKYLVVR